MSATGYAGGDPNKVNVAGDTMTGALVLPGDPTGANQAADKHYVDSAIAAASGAVVSVNGRTGAVTLSAADVLPISESQVTSLTTDLAGKLPLATVTTKADLIVASGNAMVARLGVGADNTVLTADSAAPNGVAWLPGSFTTVFRSAYIANASDFTLPNTGGAWQIMTGFELDIPASAGHLVELSVRGMRSDTSGACVDLAFVVGGSIVRYLSTGTSSPALEGDPAWYFANSFMTQSSDRKVSLVSGDIDTGNLRVVLVAKASGAGTVYSSANYPWWWALTNIGPHN